MIYRLLTLLILAAIAPVSIAADKDSDSRRDSGPSREDFKDVVIYNIFNPDRGPKKTAAPRKKVERKPAPPRVERLTLTGIIMGNEGNYGFFDGSNNDFQRVVKQGDKLADFDIAKITTEYVDLNQGTNKFQLKIRGELSKRGSEAWQTSTPSSKSTYSRTSSAFGSSSDRSASETASTSSSTQSSSSSGGNTDDESRKQLLEKLMKRRAAGK